MLTVALYAQRWSEYVASASLMLLLTCAVLGIRETHTIICIVALMATTQVFGWLTELHSSHFIDEGAKPYTFLGYQLTRRWRVGTWRHRLQFHFFGYIPYVAAWFVVFNQFSINMQALSSSVPSFVQTATTSSFVVFTVFGLVQLAHQVLPYGPSLYWAGEFTYVVLSFVAKANLVCTVAVPVWFASKCCVRAGLGRLVPSARRRRSLRRGPRPCHKHDRPDALTAICSSFGATKEEPSRARSVARADSTNKPRNERWSKRGTGGRTLEFVCRRHTPDAAVRN